MDIKWSNCTKEEAIQLNEWLICKGESSGNIKRYAMFDHTFSSELEYYESGQSKYDERIDDLVKVVYIDHCLMAYVVMNYFTYEDIREIGINPIVVNPDFQNKGYGKVIIKHLIDHTYEIINSEVDRISVALSKKNDLSIRLFERLHFKKSGSSEDESFVYYRYDLLTKDSY